MFFHTYDVDDKLGLYFKQSSDSVAHNMLRNSWNSYRFVQNVFLFVLLGFIVENVINRLSFMYNCNLLNEVDHKMSLSSLKSIKVVP